ncbi:MAG: hypothetical protein KHZ52_08595 [Actinomyces graevenitzii]|jgi:hypothetical protein|nr:hypothetical protein [Actinomyces graevenitzii]
MCESQSEKAFNEKLARSQQISGQVSQVSLQPMPFVPPPKKVLSAKGKRKRLIFYMLALCFAIPAVSLILSPFILGYIIAGVPGDHGDSGDALAWMPIGAFMSIVPIGFAVLVFALTMFGLGRGVSR